MKISSKSESLLILMKSYLCASPTSPNHSNMGTLNGHTTCRCECIKWLFCLSLFSQFPTTHYYSEQVKFPKTTMCLCLCAKSLQSCLTVCDPIDCSPPDSSLHGILQARILKWVAIPFSRRSSRRRDQTYAAHLLHRQANSLTLVPPWKHQPVPHVVNKQ